MPARTSHASNRSLRTSRLAWLSLAAAAALAPFVAGCELPIAMMIADDVSNDDQPVSDYGADGYYGGSQSALETKNAELAGNLGEAVDFSAAANFVDAYDDGYYTSITLWADGSNTTSGQWAAMSVLNIEGGGGISNEIFKPGATLHFSWDDYGSPYVYTWGCSGTGQDADMLDYEADANETDIEVTESDEPGMVHLSITGTYGDGQTVHSELDVVVPQ
jgi:hypothetical protein